MNKCNNVHKWLLIEFEGGYWPEELARDSIGRNLYLNYDVMSIQSKTCGLSFQIRLLVKIVHLASGSPSLTFHLTSEAIYIAS